MSIKSDLDEVTAAWQSASWHLRLWLALSGFLAVSSIASLADEVAKWKGFILAGVEFYRDYIVAPIANVLPTFGIHLSRGYTEYFIAGGLLLISAAREVIVRTNWKDKSDRASTIAILLIYPIGPIFVLYRVNGSPENPNWLVLWGLFGMWLVIPILDRAVNRVVYYAPVAIGLLVTLLLAAINLGLSR